MAEKYSFIVVKYPKAETASAATVADAPEEVKPETPPVEMGENKA